MSSHAVGRRRSLRSTLLLGAASAAAIAVAGPALAQDQVVETVIVTGSRIPQTGLYSSSPVTAVGQQEMKFEGTTNVENLLNNLPSAFADQGEAASNGSTGTATVNLRDLGSVRTLVLIDGKRLMPGDPTVPSPDLNQIPASLVDHVEVVTGGASAVYGSDAVAGVVNFIMRKDFEGVELDGQYSINQHNNDNSTYRSYTAAGLGGTNPGSIPQAPSSVLQGADIDGTVIMGVNSADGKGNVTAYAGYRNIQSVLESQYDVSACGTATTFGGGFACIGSSTAASHGAGGRFTSLDGGSCANCTVDGTNGAVRPFTPSDTYNFAPVNFIQRPDTRYTFGAMGHYEVSKMADIYGSVMFADDDTFSQAAPSGAFYGTPLQVNCANPELTAEEVAGFCTSAGLGPTDNANLFIGRRNVEGGPRQEHLRHTSYRMVIGAKGDLGGGWTYDAFAQYGATVFQEEFLNDVSIVHINRALDVDPATGQCASVVDGTDPTCVPWNIFVPNGVTKAATNYIGAPGFEEGSTQEWVAGASVTGDLGAWGIQSPWSKNAVGIAVGTEYRQEKLAFNTDLEFSSGDLAGQGGPTVGTGGGYSVSEGYGEVSIPVVQQMPFFEDLSLNAGYRYSSYSTAGAVTSYKYGGEWQPIDDFRIRGSFQRAVRAPNVVELFSPQTLGDFGGTDPCAGSAPVFTAAQCANTGVTAAEYGHVLQCVSSQCSHLSGGNPSLKPEQSDTRELGVVFTPTFLDGFTATVDYFDIRLDGEISVVPEAETLGKCATTGSSVFCNLIHRSTTPGAGDGVIFGTGPTSGFVTATNVNTGSVQTKGVDVEANYTADLSDWGMGDNGSLAFNLLGTYTKNFKTEPVPGDHIYDCAGLFGVTCGTPIPKWRHKLRVTWNTPWDVDLSASWRYMSSVKFDGNTNDPTLAGQGPCGGPCGDLSDAKINAYTYIDLAADWTVRQGISLHAGVSNVFDKDPPILDTNSLGISSPELGNGNTYPQVYDALGRLIFVGATLKY